jgi:inner-membrane translocator
MKKKVISALLVGSMALSLMACGGGNKATTTESSKAAAAGDTASSGGKNVVFMPKLVGIPYFTTCNEGAQEAAKELGITCTYNGPTTADAAQQVTMLEDYIAQGVDAIAVAPNDPAAMASVLKKAKDAGILVMDWDTQADPSLTKVSVCQVNDQKFGEHMVDKLIEYMGTDSGQIALVTGGLSAANLNAWIKASKDYLAKKYPNIEIVNNGDPYPTDEKQDVAYSTTKDIMKAYPNVIGILGYSTPSAPGCGEAIRDLGLQDKVTLVANGVEADIQDVLSDGSLDCGNLWNTQDLGRITMAVASYLLQGKELKNGEKIPGWDQPIILSEDGHNVYMTESGTDYEKK